MYFSLHYKMPKNTIVQKGIMFSYCCGWGEVCIIATSSKFQSLTGQNQAEKNILKDWT